MQGPLDPTGRLPPPYTVFFQVNRVLPTGGEAVRVSLEDVEVPTSMSGLGYNQASERQCYATSVTTPNLPETLRTVGRGDPVRLGVRVLGRRGGRLTARVPLATDPQEREDWFRRLGC